MTNTNKEIFKCLPTDVLGQKNDAPLRCPQ